MQLPTGGGKTVEFSLIVKRYTDKFDKSVLILVHREELLNQAKDTIFEMFGIRASLIVAGTKSVPHSKVYIGMVESVYTRAEFLHNLNAGLVIIDECHINSFNKMHSIFLEEMIIGCTATPISSNKKEPVKKYYSKIVCGPSIKQLIEMRFLAQNITRCPSDVVDETLLKIDAKSGDFDSRTMSMEYSKTRFIINTYKYYLQWCKGQKTIIFNVDIEHSKEVQQCFELAGVPCKHIDGFTPKDERREIFKWFRETHDAVLCNVGITTFGFDEPTIRNVICNFATLSLAKWIQACGRGGRFIEGIKETFNIIDLGGNSVRFGDWSDERNWEDIFNNPEKASKGGGVAPTKTCPSCKGLIHAAVAVCPLKDEKGELCLHVFDKARAEEEQRLGELIIVTKNIDIEAIMKAHVKNKTYSVFYELGRVHVQKLKDLNRELSEPEVSLVLREYLNSIRTWHRKAFPNKRYLEKWHAQHATDHFKNELEKAFSQQKQTA